MVVKSIPLGMQWSKDKVWLSFAFEFPDLCESCWLPGDWQAGTQAFLHRNLYEGT
jgi:hypothetical protein